MTYVILKDVKNRKGFLLKVNYFGDQGLRVLQIVKTVMELNLLMVVKEMILMSLDEYAIPAPLHGAIGA